MLSSDIGVSVPPEINHCVGISFELLFKADLFLLLRHLTKII